LKVAQQKAEQEVELLRTQTATYKQELDTKTTQLSQVQNDFTLQVRPPLSSPSLQPFPLQVAELQSQLTAATSELELARASTTSLEARVAAQGEEIAHYMEQLKAERAARVKEEEGHAKMQQAQDRMVELMQGKDVEKDGQLAELNNAIADLRQQYTDLEGKRTEERTKLEETIASLKETHEEEIREAALGKEGATPQALVPVSSGLTMLSPSVVNRFLGSETELYTKFMETEKALLEERMERKRLEESMDFIMQEVDSKAPMIEQQKAEYAHMVPLSPAESPV
jgi:nucleoprotein TPR